MATAVKQTLTQLLQPTPAQAAGVQLRANGSDTAANAFSQTLERKMSEPERAPEPQAQRPQESAKPQERQAVQGKQAETEKPPEAAEPPRDTAPTEANAKPAGARDATGKESTDAQEDATATADVDATDDATAASEAATSAELIAGAPAALAVEAAKTAKPAAESAAASVSLMDGKNTGKGGQPAELAAAVLTDDTSATDTKADLKGDVRADIGNGKGAAARVMDSDIRPGAAALREGTTNFAEQLEQRITAGVKPGEPLPMTAQGGQAAAGNATAAVAGGTPMQPAMPAAVKSALPSHLATPATSGDWPDAVGNRVLWLAGKDESKADLILTPPSLGKLEISLTVTGDTTTAQFTAATPAAREALEQAMPRLREMLEQAGITLAESNVNTASQDQASGGGQDGHGQRGRHGGSADMSMNAVGTPAGQWMTRGEGMIDTFA